MARRRKARRQTFVYVGKKTRSDISELSKYIPSLSKLKGKTRITTQEKSQLTKARKELRYRENLKPVSAAQAKILKKKGFLAPIYSKKKEGRERKIIGHTQAIKLRETSPDAKVKVHNDGVVVVSNGRTWEYHPVTATPDALIDAGEKLLKRKDVGQINLWNNYGRVNASYSDPVQWAEFIRTTFLSYEGAGDYIHGIAARLKQKRGS